MVAQKPPPLSFNDPIVDPRTGRPTQYFIDWWNRQSQVNDDIAGAVPQSRVINTTGGVEGGGNLSADRTLQLTDTGVTPGSYGDTANIPTFTVDGKGRLSLASEVPADFTVIDVQDTGVDVVTDVQTINFVGATVTEDPSGTAKVEITGGGGGGGGGVAVTGTLHVRQQEAAGVDGGTSVSGLNTRVLNTEVVNDIAGASLAANQVTLPEGSYYVKGLSSCFRGNNHKAYLYNVTDASTDIVGTSEYSDSSTDGSGTISVVQGVLTLAATKTFEIRHYITTGRATNGLGISSASGEVEVYVDAVFLKFNPPDEPWAPDFEQVVAGGSLSAGSNTYAHGLASTPVFVRTFMRCLTAEQGYSVGDVVELWADHGGGPEYGVQWTYDGANIYLILAISGLAALNKTTGNFTLLTAASWEVVVQAWKAWPNQLAGGGAVDSVDGRTGVVVLNDLYAAAVHNHNGTSPTFVDIAAQNIDISSTYKVAGKSTLEQQLTDQLYIGAGAFSKINLRQATDISGSLVINGISAHINASGLANTLISYGKVTQTGVTGNVPESVWQNTSSTATWKLSAASSGTLDLTEVGVSAVMRAKQGGEVEFFGTVKTGQVTSASGTLVRQDGASTVVFGGGGNSVAALDAGIVQLRPSTSSTLLGTPSFPWSTAYFANNAAITMKDSSGGVNSVLQLATNNTLRHGQGISVAGQYFYVNGVVELILFSDTLRPATDLGLNFGAASQRFGKGFFNTFSLTGLPVYADNTAAAALATGDVYRTATGDLKVKY